MAEGFARKYGIPDLVVLSAGSKPTYAINTNAILVMKELDIDISGQHPKYFSEKMVKKANYFISMGCGVQESCPVPLMDVKTEDWNLEDPVGKDLDTFRKVRDEIKQKVIELLTRLNVLRKNKD